MVAIYFPTAKMQRTTDMQNTADMQVYNKVYNTGNVYTGLPYDVASRSAWYGNYCPRYTV